MRTALLLSALLGARAYAAPDPAALMRSALPAGFAPAAFAEPVFIPVPVPVLMRLQLEGDTQTVALAPLLDRHLAATDSFSGAGGRTLVSGTLDLAGDGYLAVTPPGGPARFVKIERGMSGTWSDGVHSYRVTLSVNIFRPRLANFIQIRDTATGQLVWENRILELFRLTYAAGEPVNLAGRPYRLFYSQKPTLGLCFIYDDASSGTHDYKFYMVPVNQIQGPAPVSYRMFGGDVVRLHASSDLSTLQITR
ncbi:MAG: hypothetical protein PHS14_16155 [Elusimicrobia bacterium]|nr:hypothetical protein [Elusimicrobiota bacterium]